MNKVILGVVAVLFTLPGFAKQNCYEAKRIEDVAAYSIDFKQDVGLWKNASGNYSLRLQAGNKYGCHIFSLVEKLEGKYYTAVTTAEYSQSTRLVSTCEGKQDYEFVQFVDAGGKPVFRIQCSLKAYEDQLPQPFAPKFDDVSDLTLKGASKGQKLGNVLVVEPTGAQQQ